MRSLARALIESENNSASPAGTQEIRAILYWWKNEGGREELLSELPIEERNALEAVR